MDAGPQSQAVVSGEREDITPTGLAWWTLSQPHRAEPVLSDQTGAVEVRFCTPAMICGGPVPGDYMP